MTTQLDTTVSSALPLDQLTPDAVMLVRAGLQAWYDLGPRDEPPGVHHWWWALLERRAALVESLVAEVSAGEMQRALARKIAAREFGDALPADELIVLAVARAKPRHDTHATERDVAAVVLQMAGCTLADESNAFYISSQAVSPSSLDAPATGAAAEPAQPPTPTLEQVGWDLTRAARAGQLRPVVERDHEIRLIIETLCRTTKRNPVLVGPAGVGKTALVEGLAWRIAHDDVPAVLRGVRVIAITASTLNAGCSLVGDFEARMKAVITEACQDGIILFIDEVHTIIGAGGRGNQDVANILKPALARGELACIAATTDDEYRRFIEADTALERRFQPVRVQEPSPEQTLAVLRAVRDRLDGCRQVQVPEAILQWLITFAAQYLRNRHFPDKAIDLLEQCVAYAVANGNSEVTTADARAVAERMIGMPCALDSRLESLQTRLDAQRLLCPADRGTLLSRLAVTMRGLDLRAERPNAVLLLTEDAASLAETLARALAETLFGAAERIVVLDFALLAHPDDVTLLLGARPGYVGYERTLPLHDVAQKPWCVLRCDNLHACHPYFLDLLTAALSSGYVTDSSGKRIYLSDTVVLLSAENCGSATHALGFTTADCRQDTVVQDEEIATTLGHDLLRAIDIICRQGQMAEGNLRHWITQTLLAPLAAKYRPYGLQLTFDASIIAWLEEQQTAMTHEQDWERLIDEQISPVLVPLLAAGTPAHQVSLVYDGCGVQTRRSRQEVDDQRASAVEQVFPR